MDSYSDWVIPPRYEELPGFLSSRQIGAHFEQHHLRYARRLAQLESGTDFENVSPAQIVEESRGRLWRNAAQVLNHNLFWLSMSPNRIHTRPQRELLKYYGDWEDFRNVFVEAGMGIFGSGYVWLCVSSHGTAVIVPLPDAERPEGRPLLNCDVWEHSYYLDYENGRRQYLESFVDNYADWAFAEAQLQES